MQRLVLGQFDFSRYKEYFDTLDEYAEEAKRICNDLTDCIDDLYDSMDIHERFVMHELQQAWVFGKF